MKKLLNVWCPNPFFEWEDASVAKKYVQVPERYGKTKKVIRGGEEVEVPDAAFQDANTFRLVRHIANVAINVAPIDERTGRLKPDKDESKRMRQVLGQLKRLNPEGDAGEFVRLEDEAYAWVLRMAEERGHELFRGNADAVTECLKLEAKEPGEAVEFERVVPAAPPKPEPAPKNGNRVADALAPG